MQTPEDHAARPDMAPVVNVDDHAVAEAPAGAAPPSLVEPPAHDEGVAVEPEVAGTGKPSAMPFVPPVIAVHDLDWEAVRHAASAAAIRARMHTAVEQMEKLPDQSGGPDMLFDADRETDADRVIRVSALWNESPLWIIGDLHGDLPALETALAQIRRQATIEGSAAPHHFSR